MGWNPFESIGNKVKSKKGLDAGSKLTDIENREYAMDGKLQEVVSRIVENLVSTGFVSRLDDDLVPRVDELRTKQTDDEHFRYDISLKPLPDMDYEDTTGKMFSLKISGEMRTQKGLQLVIHDTDGPLKFTISALGDYILTERASRILVILKDGKATEYAAIFSNLGEKEAQDLGKDKSVADFSKADERFDQLLQFLERIATDIEDGNVLPWEEWITLPNPRE